LATKPTKGGNPVSTQAGIETRDRIVELVATNIDNGGDGMTRADLAEELGLSKPGLHKHLTRLFKDRRLKQIGMKVLPSTSEHIHICRTCGKTMH
jgi:DNA-binding Lrp family transcriptional regulator